VTSFVAMVDDDKKMVAIAEEHLDKKRGNGLFIRLGERFARSFAGILGKVENVSAVENTQNPAASVFEPRNKQDITPVVKHQAVAADHSQDLTAAADKQAGNVPAYMRFRRRETDANPQQQAQRAKPSTMTTAKSAAATMTQAKATSTTTQHVPPYSPVSTISKYTQPLLEKKQQDPASAESIRLEKAILEKKRELNAMNREIARRIARRAFVYGTGLAVTTFGLLILGSCAYLDVWTPKEYAQAMRKLIPEKIESLRPAINQVTNLGQGLSRVADQLDLKSRTAITKEHGLINPQGTVGKFLQELEEEENAAKVTGNSETTELSVATPVVASVTKGTASTEASQVLTPQFETSHMTPVDSTTFEIGAPKATGQDRSWSAWWWSWFGYPYPR